jgi:phosphoserine phosphatase RsbU/P
MAYLKLVQGVEPGRVYELSPGETVVGRSGDCTIPLDAAAVSRHHAKVRSDGPRFLIEDLGSRNGTYVNGERIAGARALAPGDRIVICDQEFEFGPPAMLGSSAMPLSGLLSGALPKDESTLSQMVVDDDAAKTRAGYMKTLDLGAGAGSWSMSAKPEVKLAALLEISNGLGRAISVDEVLPKILDSLFKIFVQADRGFIIMRPKEDGPLVPVQSKSRRADMDEKMRISRTIVEEAVSAKRAILSADAASDERFGMAQSIADFQIRSMMCAPMIDSDGVALGVIQIDTLNQRTRFSEDDLEVLAAVASQAATALDNAKMHDQMVSQRALQRDLELAAQMQRALLPKAAPEVAGYQFFDYYEAARQIGGDYYDYVSLPGGKFAVVLGDVAGKGVAAALIMARLSSDVRYSLAIEPDPAQAIMRINRAFVAQGLEDRFVTMIVLTVDPAKNEVTIVNAGHMNPMLRHATGEVKEIAEEIAGLPLGVYEDYEYESYQCQLQPGECFTVYTDGFSEAMNEARELYSIERIAKQVGLDAATVEAIGGNVLNDIRKFVAGYTQSDDMCLACFGRL